MSRTTRTDKEDCLCADFACTIGRPMDVHKGDLVLRVDYTLDAYMVHDAVWEKAGMGHRGFLHLKCLERRLGRKLVLEDFTTFPINNSIRFAYAMGKREGIVEYGADLGRQILEIANTTGLEPVNVGAT